MTYSIPLNDEPMPKQIADALARYYAEHGTPPPVAESIVVFVEGQWIVVDLFSVKETT